MGTTKYTQPPMEVGCIDHDCIGLEGVVLGPVVEP